MTRFRRNILPHVEHELALAAEAEQRGDDDAAFKHLERAHVLGQPSTVEHVRVHWRMLRWGLRRRSARECVGQIVRIVGAATKTAIGLVPEGNTGGADISPFRRLPVPRDLASVIENARRG